MKKTQEKISGNQNKPLNKQEKSEKNPIQPPPKAKQDPPPKKLEEKKSLAQNDDSSDEESENIRNFKKKSIPKQPDFNNTMSKMNVEQSNNYSLNLLKERGCTTF